MPKYTDSVGFLLELRSDINENWFNRVTDLSIQLNGSQVSEAELEDLWLYLLKKKNYIPQASPVQASVTTTQSNTPAVFFERIDNFDNFKKLSPSLKLEFGKKITLVFGKNGAGKSSICQALKILASPDKPINPIINARVQSNILPSFHYQFKGWQSSQKWDEKIGFGSQSQFIKYFDSTVAISNVTGKMRAKNSVEVSVFKLELFEFCRNITFTFQEFSKNKVAVNKSVIINDMQAVLSRLKGSVDTSVEPFTTWTPENSIPLENWLKTLLPFTENELLEISKLEIELKQIQTASTDQGKLTLQAQLDLLNRTTEILIELQSLCGNSCISEMQIKEQSVLQKNAALIELSRDAFPQGIDPVTHNDLLHSAEKTTLSLNSEKCPLCFQTLNLESVQLFDSYRQHLTSTLHSEVRSLNQEIEVAKISQEKIRVLQLLDLSLLNNMIQPELSVGLTNLVNTIKSALPQIGQPQSDGNLQNFIRHTELTAYITAFQQLSTQLKGTLKTAKENDSQLVTKELEVKNRIGSLRASQAIQNEMQNLLSICSNSSEYKKINAKFNSVDFSSLYRKLTNKGKEAHSNLVLGTFESKLNSEYISLCGMNLSQLGVKLDSKGSDQDITITPNIGKSHVQRVLSEGEQKIHSLAVFMAEATAHPHQMLVFDDPVTSFDYNYVSNFCERIRDLIRTQPDTQMVFLTHNWDFFINLQAVLNRSGFNNSISIQVLEDCSTVTEYKESWDSLCHDIELIVNASNEPNAEIKERVSGLMRRLIERLTNSYVFNEQRHQYKNKSLPISDFNKFTKIVPLLVDEANELRDLYSNLSPSEHDDIRNFYVTKSRLQFKNWYDRIVIIKVAVELRKVSN